MGSRNTGELRDELITALTRAADTALPLIERHEAFAVVMRRFQDLAYGYALSQLGEVEPARDAAQEAFLQAWKSLPELREPAAFPAWFRRILHTCCHRHVRSKRLTTSLETAACLADPADGPFEATQRSELRRTVSNTIRSLPERERTVTTLFYINEYSQNEIAAFLEAPLTTVQKRLQSARRRLRQRLGPQLNERTIPMVQDTVQQARPSQDAHFVSSVQLFNAVQTGDVEAVRAILAADPTLVGATHRGIWGERAPLHLAAEKGYTEIACLLLEHGADVMARDQGDNATSLHWAAGEGHLDVLQLLIDHGAEVNADDDMHLRGPLGWAMCFQVEHKVVADALLAAGATPNVFHAIALDRPELIRALVNEDPEVLNQRMSLCEDFGTPLHFAIEKSRHEVVSLLLELGADFGAVTGSGRTPLFHAIAAKNDVIRDLLLQHGAQIDLLTAIVLNDTARVEAELAKALPEPALNPALLVAAEHGRTAIVDRLLALGASVDCTGQVEWIRGATPLAAAAYRGHTETIRRLLAAGVDPNHRDEYPGAMPIHHAAISGHTAAVAALMEGGADPTLRDKVWEGDALGWAAECKQTETIDYLLKRGIPIGFARAAYLNRLDLMRTMLDADPSVLNSKDKYGTALHQASLHGFTEIVRFLLERGADTQATNRNGDSVLMMLHKAKAGLASPSGLPEHVEIERLLIEAGATR